MPVFLNLGPPSVTILTLTAEEGDSTILLRPPAAYRDHDAARKAVADYAREQIKQMVNDSAWYGPMPDEVTDEEAIEAWFDYASDENYRFDGSEILG